MKRYIHNGFVIEIVNEPDYRIGTADNKFNYSKQYFNEDGYIYSASGHAVKVFLHDRQIYSCIVIGGMGATGVSENSSVLDIDQLAICCSDMIFCLSIPDLELKWMTKTDDITCFQIFNLQDDYIVHGELAISRIDKNGNIKWQYGGTDIFVTLDDSEEFVLKDDHIALTSFDNITYKVDFDGKTIYTSYK